MKYCDKTQNISLKPLSRTISLSLSEIPLSDNLSHGRSLSRTNTLPDNLSLGQSLSCTVCHKISDASLYPWVLVHWISSENVEYPIPKPHGVMGIPPSFQTDSCSSTTYITATTTTPPILPSSPARKHHCSNWILFPRNKKLEVETGYFRKKSTSPDPSCPFVGWARKKNKMKMLSHEYRGGDKASKVFSSSFFCAEIILSISVCNPSEPQLFAMLSSSFQKTNMVFKSL